MTKRYEYKVIVTGINNYEATLQAWGSKGWMYLGSYRPKTPLGHDEGTIEITMQREYESDEAATFTPYHEEERPYRFESAEPLYSPEERRSRWRR